MSETHPTAPTKPSKPSPDFPLFPHATGRWAKKIRGKMYYFGKWDDPEGALAKYDAEKEALHAGRKPRTDPDALTVKQLCNKFLIAKMDARDAGELTPRTWQDYKDACDLVVRHFGKSRLVDDLGPDDFAKLRNIMAKKWGPTTVHNMVNRMRVAFKFAFDNGLITRPVHYGQGFKRPSKKTLRLERARKGAKLFTRDEVRALLKGALVVGEEGPELVQPGTQLKAMILLGINCGFGNADCGSLPLSAVDFDRAFIDFPRPKTGIPRRCPLWPETVAAIREALAERPQPKKPEHAGFVFMTKYGAPWAKLSSDNTLAKEMGKLLKRFRINGRQGLGFYTLRHTFRTIADESKDQPACDYIMGHEVPHMASVYREVISDARLRVVADTVHAWLFGAV